MICEENFLLPIFEYADDDDGQGQLKHSQVDILCKVIDSLIIIILLIVILMLRSVIKNLMFRTVTILEVFVALLLVLPSGARTLYCMVNSQNKLKPMMVMMIKMRIMMMLHMMMVKTMMMVMMTMM